MDRARQDSQTNSRLAYGVSLGFFATLAIVLLKPALLAANPAAQTMIGVLGTAWVTIVSYYFGSSAGSKEKTALLEDRVGKD